MERINGILLLVNRSPNGGNLDVLFGLRSHNEIPEWCCAVGGREYLESIGLEITGDNAVISVEDVFKEWLVASPLQEHVQSLGESGSEFVSIQKNELGAAWAALQGDLGKGLKLAWRCVSNDDMFFLLYDSASYKGGIKPDDNTFGSSLYALVAINSGLYWKTPQSTTGAANPTEVLVNDADESVWLQRLSGRYPEVASKLLSRVRSGGAISGEIDNVACNIWWLGQLWLTFLDGDDFGLTDDREIYDHVKALAAQSPRCSIEEEAWAWMQARAANMSKFEIKLGLDCAVKSVGTLLIFNGNYDDTYQEIVRGDHRYDISD